jgi:hypothetical protein
MHNVIGSNTMVSTKDHLATAGEGSQDNAGATSDQDYAGATSEEEGQDNTGSSIVIDIEVPIESDGAENRRAERDRITAIRAAINNAQDVRQMCNVEIMGGTNQDKSNVLYLIHEFVRRVYRHHRIILENVEVTLMPTESILDLSNVLHRVSEPPEAITFPAAVLRELRRIVDEQPTDGEPVPEDAGI